MIYNRRMPGSFVCKGSNTYKEVYIYKIIYSNPATIVFWSDNTKTISKCHPDDKYSKELGVYVAIMKKIYSSTEYKDFVDSWINTDSNRVGLNDVRRKLKKNNSNT